MENGIYYDLPFEKYLAEPRLNCSGIKKLNRSPLHYKASLKEHFEQTKALLIGSAVHCLTLEPTEFESRYAVAPKLDKRTNAGKLAWAVLESDGKIVLSEADYQQIEAMAEAVHNHPSAKSLLAKGHPELTVFSEIDGVKVKARADWYRPGILCDLKTTEDASPEGFARSVANYGYDQQCSFYLDVFEAAGIEVHSFIFIAIEKTAPWAVSLTELNPDSIEHGRRIYQKGLAAYKKCTESGDWPGYDPSIVTISLPAWALRDI